MNEQQIKALVQSILSRQQYSVGKVPYHTHSGTDSPNVSYGNLLSAPDAFCLATVTNGTAAVSLFPLGAPSNLTITGVFLIANDTTAGNITLKNNGTTVATIAKGTSAGAMVGAISLANTAYLQGKPLTVVSSSAGNATVFITFTV